MLCSINKMMIKRYLGLIVLLVLTSACGRGTSPMCVYADDFGDTITRSFELKAEGVQVANSTDYEAVGWIDTGVDVAVPRSLQISSYGNIELCPRTNVTETFVVPARASGWLPTSTFIDSNLEWKIIGITGGYNSNCQVVDDSSALSVTAQCIGADGSNKTVTLTRPDVDAEFNYNTVPVDADHTDRTKLYAYVGDAPDPAWFGEEMYGSKLGVDSPVAEANYFFKELTGTPVDGNLFTESGFNYSGQLFFRLKDSPDVANVWPEDSVYQNNIGSYTVVVNYTRTCIGKNGQFMQASIGQSPGLAGTVVDLTPYAKGVNDEKPGVFNGGVWATGRLWLRILDDANKRDWIGFEGISKGDSDYTPRPAIEAFTEPSNMGRYFVDVVTTAPFKDGISDIVNVIIDPIKDVMYGDPESDDPAKYGLTKRMYLSLTGNIDYIDGLRALVTLAVTIYALAYLIGIVDVSVTQFAIWLIKGSLVLVLISDASWTFFYDNLFRVFIKGMDELIWMMSGQFADAVSQQTGYADIQQLFVAATDPTFGTITDGIPVVLNGQEGVIHGEEANFIRDHHFIAATEPMFSIALENGGSPIQLGGIDGVLYDSETLKVNVTEEVSKNAFGAFNQTLSKLFSKETNIKISALFSAFPMGWLYAIGIYVGIFYFVIGFIRAVLMYMIAIIGVAILLFLAPIFIPFILFNQLKGMFDIYIKNLIGFVLQPVFMFAVLSLFNIFVISLMYVLFYYNVCWDCIWAIDLPLNKLFKVSENFDRFCLMDGYRPWGVTQSRDLDARLEKMPVNLITLLMFLIVTSAINAFLDWATDVANVISGGSSVSGISSITRNMMAGAAATAANTLQAAPKLTGLSLAKDAIGKAGGAINDKLKKNAAKREGAKSAEGKSDNSK